MISGEIAKRRAQLALEVCSSKIPLREIADRAHVTRAAVRQIVTCFYLDLRYVEVCAVLKVVRS